MSKANKIFFDRAMGIHRSGPVFWDFMLYGFALFYGFVYGSLAPVTPYLISNRFGRQMLGATYGLLTFFSTGIGGALGPILGGFIFDKTGSYRSGWIMNTIFLLIISLLILALKPSRSRLPR